MYSARVGRAIEVAAVCHEGQYRKDPRRRLPYIVHPLAVGLMLAHHDYPEDVVIAGILHDVVEDTPMTLDTLREEFGVRVATLVEQTSESDKSLPWEERKTQYSLRLQSADDEVKAISCCDKIHNMRSLIDSLTAGADMWAVLSRGKQEQIEQFRKAEAIYQGSVRPKLQEEYRGLLERLVNL